jgi:hypothetical protein
MAQGLEHLNCVQWSALPFLMARSNTISQHCHEATTDGVWHAAACSKHRIFNTKTPFCNWSSYYAMAVIELGQQVAASMATNSNKVPK